jgi:hypothetical protein
VTAAELDIARERLARARQRVERAAGSADGTNDPNLPLGQIVDRASRGRQQSAVRADRSIVETAAAFRELEAAERDVRVKEATARQLACDAETVKGVTPETLKTARFIRDKSGGWHRVKKVNAKSVTVPSIVGGSWDDRVPIAKIVEVRP